MRILLACTFLLSAASYVGAAEPGDFLDKEGRLNKGLSFSESEATVAGVKLRKLVIGSKGDWGYLEGQPGPNDKETWRIIARGQLTPAEVKALAEQLAKHDLLGLPLLQEPVKKEQALPHHAFITYGSKRFIYIGPFVEVKDLKQPEQRFAGLAHFFNGFAKRGEYLDQDGHLKQRLVLLDTQSGGDGISLRRFTVEPTGLWRLESGQSLETKDVYNVIAKGQLSPAGIKAVAELLEKHDLLRLPKSLKGGGLGKANPHSAAITFGARRFDFNGNFPDGAHDPLRAEFRFRELSNIYHDVAKREWQAGTK